MNDIELIKKLLQGNEESFNELFKKYKDFTYRISFHILNDRDDAMDNVTNAWIKIYKALLNKTFQFKSKFSTWIYKIITNEALMLLKTRKSEVSLDAVSYNKYQNNYYSVEMIEDKIYKEKRIEKLKNHLTPIQQKIIDMLMQGYKFQEIAKELQITTNYLYQLTSRIKKSLKNIENL